MSETHKNLGGRPRTGAIPLTVRMPPSELSDLDAYIATLSDQPKPSRPEAIRQIVRSVLNNKQADRRIDS